MNPLYRPMLRSPALWLASGFGAGLSSWAPGTVGTLVAVLPWLLMRDLPLPLYFLIVALTFAIGVWSAQRVIDRTGVEDPGVVVLDEWIGLWIGLTLLPEGWLWLAIGVLVFRFFDILKPWPVSWIDREIHGGIGTMLDDALAGVFALLTLQGMQLVWVWIP